MNVIHAIAINNQLDDICHVRVKFAGLPSGGRDGESDIDRIRDWHCKEITQETLTNSDYCGRGRSAISKPVADASCGQQKSIFSRIVFLVVTVKREGPGSSESLKQ